MSIIHYITRKSRNKDVQAGERDNIPLFHGQIITDPHGLEDYRPIFTVLP